MESGGYTISSDDETFLPIVDDTDICSTDVDFDQSSGGDDEEESEPAVPTFRTRARQSQTPPNPGCHLCDHENREECNGHNLSPQRKRHKITFAIHGHVNYLVL